MTKPKPKNRRVTRLDDRPMVGRLLEAATALFAKNGYASTSIEDIAAAVGVLKGSVYYYIDGKEDLLFRLLDDTREETVAIADSVALRTELSAIQRLRTYIALHVEYASRNVSRMKIYYHDVEQLSRARQNIVTAQNAYLNDFVKDLVLEAQERGDIDRDADAKVLTFFIFGAINYVHTWYRNDGQIQPADLAAIYADLVLTALTRTEAAAPSTPTGSFVALGSPPRV